MQGHVEASGQLGTLYRFGRGVEQAIAMAAQFHVRAALAGDPVSIGNLADYQLLIEKEALSGSLLATSCLAQMYAQGISVKQDVEKAKQLFDQMLALNSDNRPGEG